MGPEPAVIFQDLPDGALRVLAPAKVNLVLEVVGRRPDGYHDLEMANVTVSLYDELTLRLPGTGDPLRLTTDDPRLPAGEGNLVVKAARGLLALEGPAGTSGGGGGGISIHLRKRIPVGAGLGGGSSDAAATLLGLVRLLGLRTPPDELDRIALSVGSDVPYLMRGGGAVCRGRGEKVEPAPCPAGLPLLVAWPRVGLSTAAVYAAQTPPLTPGVGRANVLFATIRTGARGGGWGDLREQLFNRLEAPARRLCPEVGRLIDELNRMDTLGVVMSGSGSAVVALARDAGHARTIGADIGRRVSCDTFVVETVAG
ncbi:MAG: 4-(cytidine 5'-diphospho)-2-C-methyl-D-erythritol kinase [Planctomycetales bacterium]|nr:4-(cytidine 5'-diphospho)-2-C-methyl-D-erythritol kinase [Planctomycetales bacterium]